MAKVIITLTDSDDETVDLLIECSPPIPPTIHPYSKHKLTLAQQILYDMLQRQCSEDSQTEEEE